MSYTLKMSSLFFLNPSFVKDYLKLIRGVNLVLVGFTQYLTAIFLISEQQSWESIFLNKGFFLLVSATVMITSAGYLINDYYDVKIDFINKPERVLVGKKLKRRWVIAGHTFLNLSAIAIGFYLSLKIGLIFLASAFLLWLYSNQLKRLPFVGNLAIALLTGMTLLLVAEYFNERTYVIACYAIFAAFITLIREILKDMEDMKGDERFGCKTLPIVFGIATTKKILYLISVTFAITVFVLMSALSFYLPILLGIALLWLNYGIFKADTVRAFQKLSTYCKVIMLFGVISMIWI